MHEIAIFKRKFKNKIKITEKILIIFFITGRIGFSLTPEEDLLNNSFIKNEENNNTITILKHNLNLVNQGTIMSSNISSNLTSYISNAIYSKANLDKIINTGIIKGQTENFNEGSYITYSNGIVGRNILEISNSGIIAGNGNIINKNSTEILTNGFGNGFFTDSDSLSGYPITNIINNGIIKGSINIENSGKSTLDSSANGINPFSILENLTNNGIISGVANIINGNFLAKNLANGIIANSTLVSSISNVKNTGVIKGDAYLSSTSTNDSLANGIYSKDRIENIDNTGIISGISKVNLNYNDFTLNGSNGLLQDSRGSKAKDFFNKGMILGKTLIKGITSNNLLSIQQNNGILTAADFENLNNNGIIKGFSETELETSNFNSSVNSFASNGISTSIFINGTNKGLIAGISAIKTGNSQENSNIVTGATNGFLSSSNGIFAKDGMTSFMNNGFVTGVATLKSGDSTSNSNIDAFHTANGLVINGSGSQQINNNGTLNGRLSISTGNSIDNNKQTTKNSGNGFVSKSSKLNFTNLGLIKGSHGAMAINSYLPSNVIKNLGILAGREIFTNASSSSTTPSEVIKNNSLSNHINLKPVNTTQINQGLYIKLKSEMNGAYTTGNIELLNNKPIIEKIFVGSGGFIDNKEILNGSLDGNISTEEKILLTNENIYVSSKILNDNLKNNNLIINGLGREQGALIVDDNLNLTNSIINSYETALTIEDNKVFTGENIILNGGGLGVFKENLITYEDVIKGSSGDNILNLLGESYVNGNVNLNDGNNILNLSQSTIVNGNIGSGNGNNKISISDTTLINGDIILGNGNNNIQILDNSIINGDISLGNGSDNLLIENLAILNGDVDLGGGDDQLVINNSVQLNNDLDGGLGLDNLNFESLNSNKQNLGINIFNTIKNFENINIKENITLFETATISGADNININNGNLLLRVDPTIIDNNERIIGHALYENEGLLSSTGGNLVIGLNGIGEDTIISTGKTTILSDVDSIFTEIDKLKTNSSILDAILISPNEIKIGLSKNIPLLDVVPGGELPDIGVDALPLPGGELPDIGVDAPIAPPIDPELPITPDPSKPGGELPDIGVTPTEPPVTPNPYIEIDSLLYEKLNNIYQSTVESGEIGNLANTTLLEDKTYNESIGGLLTILDQIYANNPYAYTLKSSRDSLKLFEDNISYLTIKPKENELIVQGKGIYTGVKNDSSASGKNYYGFDTGHRNYKTTTSSSGGLATFEYGLSDKTSIGFVFGGNNQNTKFKGSSKIDGTSIYLGSFAKTDINNFKFMSGIGYQYTSADVDRKVSNRYDSFSTGDKYNINSLNAFAEAKYIYNVKQDWTIEPKVRLSYYHINQEAVNEGYTPGQLSLKTDKVNSNTADIEFGADFVKNLYLNNGKLKNILSLGVVNTIGDRSKDLNGYILGKEKNGKRFDIQGVELPKTSGKVSYNLEFEQTNGMIYTAGVNLEFAKDYNKNITATLGIGYKF